MALACSHSTAPTGKAKLTGKFTGAFPDEQTFTIKVAIPNLIIGGIDHQMDEYEITLEADSSFSLSIPLFCDAFGLFAINADEYDAFLLSPNKETKIELFLDDNNNIQLKTIKGRNILMEDLNKSTPLYMDFYQKASDGSLLSGLRYDMSPEEYRDYIINQLKDHAAIIETNTTISDIIKQAVSKVMKLQFAGQLFDYESEVRFLYERQQPEKGANTPDFTPIKPDRSYYSFLAFFDMNHPPLSNYPYYPRIYRLILNNSVLNISPIDSKPLQNWLKETKTIMAELIGSDIGVFYDMLTLHAYLQQLEESSKPLSTKQIKEIESYFTNPTYTNFIFEKNDELIKQLSSSKTESKQTVESIVSAYKGKVVVVDFWATWCGPCLAAMEEIKPLKKELLDKNVVFVYITDPSSPKNLWEKKKDEIGGKQYYMTENEMKYTKAHYGISGIPTYLIYDSNGNLKNKFTAYPGNDTMRQLIEKLLP
jgi:thiol-disulfide isomerase/thioredoxin